MQILEKVLDAVWPQIFKAKKLYTPSGQAIFDVVGEDVSRNGLLSVRITTANDNHIIIKRRAFLEALRYLVEHGNFGQGNQCLIEANNNPDMAGPLCQATRMAQSENGEDFGTMVISYVVPMLVDAGLVSINNARPSSVWLS
jgi:hypothetical protein